MPELRCLCAGRVKKCFGVIKMTSKETIKEFEHLLKVEKDRIHKDVVFITALENAIEALEKQVPKKVKKSLEQ